MEPGHLTLNEDRHIEIHPCLASSWTAIDENVFTKTDFTVFIHFDRFTSSST